MLSLYFLFTTVQDYNISINDENFYHKQLFEYQIQTMIYFSEEKPDVEDTYAIRFISLVGFQYNSN